MSNATTVTTFATAAANAAGGVVAPTNVDNPAHSHAENARTDINQVKTKKAEETHDINLSYAVDRDAGVLRLKVSNQKGETIRELTFTDFVSTVKPPSLAKGVLVDNRL